MPSYKFATAVWTDSVAPRDAMMINPHFINNSTLGDLNLVAQEWADTIQSYVVGGSTAQTQVKIYEDGHEEPNYPLGQSTRSAGQSAAATSPREVSLCLSFYADANIPRHRGRLYLPMNWLTGSPNLAGRPSGTQLTKAAALVPLLAAMGGSAWTWCVYSPKEKQARPVTHWWVDDEWDTQRRRGLKATTRQSGVTAG